MSADIRLLLKTTANSFLDAMPSSATPARTTLIAVTGLTPAVLTETLWGLASEPTPVVPDHIVVITTLTGRAKLTGQLLANGRCDTFRTALRSHLGRKHAHLLTHTRLRFGTAQNHLRVIPTPGPAAQDADDLRTAADHQAAADFILRTVREFSEEEGNRLIFSVAGGRKTMGFPSPRSSAGPATALPAEQAALLRWFCGAGRERWLNEIKSDSAKGKKALEPDHRSHPRRQENPQNRPPLKTTTYTLELLTPCFCAGANQSVAEIRASPSAASSAGGSAPSAAALPTNA